MAYRSFKDANGVAWDVWDVVPQRPERRGRERRATPAEESRPLPDERRGPPNRRRRSAPPPATAGAGLQDGWLCFESRRERRRLAPIPIGWGELTDAELAVLCDQASAAGKPRRLIE